MRASARFSMGKAGVNVTGATSAFLTSSNVQTGQAGNYEIVIRNPYGSITSTVAVLTVNAASQGTVVAWGNSGSGERTVPAGLSGVTAIAAGGAYTVALKTDGSVVAWGRNSAGQATVPVGLSRVKAIAAGGSHTLALVGGAAPRGAKGDFSGDGQSGLRNPARAGLW